MSDSPNVPKLERPPGPHAGAPEPYEPSGTVPPLPRNDVRRAGLSGRRVVLIVSGSVAAYKAILLTRLLQGVRADLEVILTAGAKQFVGPETFSGLTGRRPCEAMFGADGELHISLARWAELIIVVPATADLMARAVQGRADDLATALLLAATCPVLMAPAMHPDMWAHAATQRNATGLHQDGVTLLGPAQGSVASGDVGLGRMMEPELILATAEQLLADGPLRSCRLVVTAGPTVEDLDPVRFIGNRSSGKMGFAIAARAAARGARVHLIAGPVSLPTPFGVERVDVRGAMEMREALWRAVGADLTRADAVVMAAAVADYRPRQTSPEKLKRNDEGLTLDLAANPDLLAELGRHRKSRHPILVGFALETKVDADLIQAARSKLVNKRVDLMVANPDAALEGDYNQAKLVGVRNCWELESMSKPELADRILDWLEDQWRAGHEAPSSQEFSE